jgi:predicted anti-sigma-YlaC factor YlaD
MYATNAMADALAESSDVYASDDDIDLVGAATPFGLKTIESLLLQTPEHRGLLLAATRGFTQYAYVYVAQPADEMEYHDVKKAYAQRERARNLYLRARDYGLRGLEIKHPDFIHALGINPNETITRTSIEDVPYLYWTGIAWAAAIALSKDDPDLIADIPLVETLIFRAYELDESFDDGAIHIFLISYEMSRRGMIADAVSRARQHFSRAVELSSGMQVAPYVALAEAVSIPQQNRSEYETLLEHALQIEIHAKPEWTLVNSVMQRRANWLLTRADQYFSD